MISNRRSFLLLFVMATAACDDGSAATPAAATPIGAPPAEAAKASLASSEEDALRLASTGKKPYKDKQILKTAIVSAWQPGELEGKKYEELVATVTVYDPRNRKCWAWNKVTYRRFPPATDVVQHAVSHEDADIAQVECASVGFTPPARTRSKSARRSSSGCRSGEKMCGANCTNTDTDRMNCGGCGNECTGDKFACNNGRCW